MLDATTEHPAAQQQRVDHQIALSSIGNHETHEPVVAESVSNIHTQYEGSAGGGGSHVELGTPSSRKIKLIRALSQLGDPWPLSFGWGSDINDECQRCDEVANIGRGT